MLLSPATHPNHLGRFGTLMTWPHPQKFWHNALGKGRGAEGHFKPPWVTLMITGCFRMFWPGHFVGDPLPGQCFQVFFLGLVRFPETPLPAWPPLIWGEKAAANLTIQDLHLHLANHSEGQFPACGRAADFYPGAPLGRPLAWWICKSLDASLTSTMADPIYLLWWCVYI